MLVSVALPLILAFIMFSLGLGLRKRDFTRVARFPKAFGIGLGNQLILLPFVGYSQFEFITGIDNQINESSGLVFLQGRIITHNDSGGEPALFEVDSTSGTVIRTVFIENAENSG